MRYFVVFLTLLLVLNCALIAKAAGSIFYAAPDGLATNSGTKASPWDLQTALSARSRVGAGDKVYLRGGIYKGHFISTLSGDVNNPVTVMSMPGEWAVIDGNEAITLANSVDTTSSNSFVLSSDINAPDPVIVMVDQEQFQITRTASRNYKFLWRGYQQVQSHAAGSPVRIQLDVLTINGSDVIFRDIEVTNSMSDRVLTVPGSGAADINRRFGGITVYAPRSKVINSVVHDTGQGFSFWEAAVDSELYGNLIYNNGEWAPDRGHGHGIYTQNATGQKNIESNVIFGNFGGYGIHTYGSSNSSLKGYTFAGNIDFLNRWLVGGGAPADDIKIYNNFLYNVGFELGYSNRNNGYATLSGNYVYAENPLTTYWWYNVNAKNNKFFLNEQGGQAIRMYQMSSAVSSSNIESNSYIVDKSPDSNAFMINVNGAVTDYNFSSWQQAGYDKAGVYQPATKPSGTSVFYSPNKYESGRGFVVIYNYDKTPTVSVDLSKLGITRGQKYVILNAQNYNMAPLGAGTYSGQQVKVQLSNLIIAQPIGNSGISNASTCPEFCVLLVKPYANWTPSIVNPNISINGNIVSIPLTITPQTFMTSSPNGLSNH